MAPPVTLVLQMDLSPTGEAPRQALEGQPVLSARGGAPRLLRGQTLGQLGSIPLHFLERLKLLPTLSQAPRGDCGQL